MNSGIPLATEPAPCRTRSAIHDLGARRQRHDRPRRHPARLSIPSRSSIAVPARSIWCLAGTDTVSAQGHSDVPAGTYTDKNGNSGWFTATERSRRRAAVAQVPDPALNQAGIGTVWCARRPVRGRGRVHRRQWVGPGVGPDGSARPLAAGSVSAGHRCAQYRRRATSAVSCASPGYCSVGGVNDANSTFVISEWHGTWVKP